MIQHNEGPGRLKAMATLITPDLAARDAGS
jgi:hypothetical protein